MGKRLITVSEMRCFKTCPRKYYYRYVRLRRPHDIDGNLSFGKAVHNVLAEQRSNPANTMKAIALVNLPDEYATAKAQAMLVGHMHRWGLGGLEIVSVNHRFQVPLVNPATGRSSNTWELAGEMDAVVHSDGSVTPKGTYVMEDKTSGQDISPGSAYWRQKLLDVQVSTYFRALKGGCDGVLYNVLGKPRLRPLGITKTRKVEETPEEYRERCGVAIAENPDKYLRREVVIRTKWDDREAAEDAWLCAKMIRHCEKSNAWPRNDNSCFNYSRECEYFGVCTGTADINDGTKFRLAEAKHEELQ